MPLTLTMRRLLTIQPIELPVFHPIAIKLQHLLEDPEYKIDEVIEIANEDTSLASQILKMANATIYVGRVRTETIKDAVVRLGAQQVSNLAMAASHASLHVSNNEVIHAFMQMLWLHSHGCAVGSRAVARWAGFGHLVDRAYMAGLLHDVGKLYLLKALERLNNAGVAQAALDVELLLDIYGELHIDQGYRVMEHWNMPKIYMTVVENHDGPSFDQSDTLLTVVRLVNKVCRMMGIGLVKDEEVDLLAEPEAELLQISQRQLDDLCELLEESKQLVL